ncbi:Imm27 family immunity protein [Aquimarina longa]|uniref:Imm27 family immunity protein n=1 Tax=Aquimarina longa TaxID=1080221 RepID=UPI0007825092|nr:Imm27 family immunity protein [Aquimarina longa]
MDLKKEETKLIGKWIFQDGEVTADSTSKRINFLKDNSLVKVATSESGWDVLYQDPKDKRYWELVYQESELQGGGAPSLINLDKDSVIAKYSINDSK